MRHMGWRAALLALAFGTACVPPAALAPTGARVAPGDRVRVTRAADTAFALTGWIVRGDSAALVVELDDQSPTPTVTMDTVAGRPLVTTVRLPWDAVRRVELEAIVASDRGMGPVVVGSRRDDASLHSPPVAMGIVGYVGCTLAAAASGRDLVFAAPVLGLPCALVLGFGTALVTGPGHWGSHAGLAVPMTWMAVPEARPLLLAEYVPAPEPPLASPPVAVAAPHARLMAGDVVRVLDTTGVLLEGRLAAPDSAGFLLEQPRRTLLGAPVERAVFLGRAPRRVAWGEVAALGFEPTFGTRRGFAGEEAERRVREAPSGVRGMPLTVPCAVGALLIVRAGEGSRYKALSALGLVACATFVLWRDRRDRPPSVPADPALGAWLRVDRPRERALGGLTDIESRARPR
jgi:hypothetical protein